MYHSFSPSRDNIFYFLSIEAEQPDLENMEQKPVSGTEEDSVDGKQFGEREDWPITHQVRELLARNEFNGEKPKKLGVTWSNLTVKGVSSDAVFNENVVSQFNPFGKGKKDTPLKTIIDHSSGNVKPGGMLPISREKRYDF